MQQHQLRVTQHIPTVKKETWFPSIKLTASMTDHWHTHLAVMLKTIIISDEWVQGDLHAEKQELTHDVFVAIPPVKTLSLQMILLIDVVVSTGQMWTHLAPTQRPQVGIWARIQQSNQVTLVS